MCKRFQLNCASGSLEATIRDRIAGSRNEPSPTAHRAIHIALKKRIRLNTREMKKGRNHPALLYALNGRNYMFSINSTKIHISNCFI
jgi:hypothetical protein